MKKKKSKGVIVKPAKNPAVEVINRQRLHKIDRAEMACLGRAVLDQIKLSNCTATITFIRDRAMQHLNRDYRGKDQPTDVLAFAYHESNENFESDELPEHLGDVVISVETAERYARELKLTFKREIEWLVIHGLLHLAGYDHETDNGEMRRLERRLRQLLL